MDGNPPGVPLTELSKFFDTSSAELSGFFDTSYGIMASSGKANAEKEVTAMKGYTVESGYMGLVEGRYMLFACEEDYLDYLQD